MSREHQLTVHPVDPTAEIAIYDGSFNRVGRGVGRYQGVHRDGLYEIRVRAGGGTEEKLISLTKDEKVDFGPVAFPSPVPLTQTANSNETHQAAVVRASRTPVMLGHGSGLLVVVRDRPKRQPVVSPESPASGLSFIGPDGARVFDVGKNAPVEAPGCSAVAAIFVHVNPGVYRLRLDPPRGGALERTLVASPGWTTQCFMMRRTIRGECVADLAQGSLSLDRLSRLFSPDDAKTRLSEVACDALANNRQVTGAATRALMSEKFQNPMLGLLVAHLLLRDTPGDSVLQEVVSNIANLLGENHPDLRAIALSIQQDAKPITEIPMLRASWDRIVSRTVVQPDLILSSSPAGHVSTSILPHAPWLVWEAANRNRSDARRVKMTALRNYMSGPIKSGPLRERGTTWNNGWSSRSYSRGRGRPQTPAVSLDLEEREELTRSLGVSGPVLDVMLSKLDT